VEGSSEEGGGSGAATKGKGGTSGGAEEERGAWRMHCSLGDTDAKAPWQAHRAKEACRAEEAKAEAARKVEEERQEELAWECAEAERRARVEAVQEAHIERQRREFEVRKVQEQQQRLQARVETIAVTQGSGEVMAVPAAATGGRQSTCMRCREHLNNLVGCMAQASLKAMACARCQAACKSCSWSTAGKVAEVSTPAGSTTEGSGKPAEKHVTKRRTRTATMSRTKQVWYSEHGR